MVFITSTAVKLDPLPVDYDSFCSKSEHLSGLSAALRGEANVLAGDGSWVRAVHLWVERQEGGHSLTRTEGNDCLQVLILQDSVLTGA